MRSRLSALPSNMEASLSRARTTRMSSSGWSAPCRRGPAARGGSSCAARAPAGGAGEGGRALCGGSRPERGGHRRRPPRLNVCFRFHSCTCVRPAAQLSAPAAGPAAARAGIPPGWCRPAAPPLSAAHVQRACKSPTLTEACGTIWSALGLSAAKLRRQWSCLCCPVRHATRGAQQGAGCAAVHSTASAAPPPQSWREGHRSPAHQVYHARLVGFQHSWLVRVAARTASSRAGMQWRLQPPLVKECPRHGCLEHARLHTSHAAS